MMIWMHSETSAQSRQKNDNCMYTVPKIEVYLCLNSHVWIPLLGIASLHYSDSWLHSLTMCFLNVSFQDSLFLNFTPWLKSVHIIYFQIGALVAQKYKLVRNKLHQHSKYWELRSLCVCAVHWWTEVAGYLAELLNRICLLKILLWCSSSFDRAWICRSYLGFRTIGPSILLSQYWTQWS